MVRFESLCWCTLAVIALAGQQARAQATDARQPDSQIRASFDVAAQGDFLIVPVTIDNGSYPFVLDTASTVTVFDTRFQEQLGEPLKEARLQTPNGTSVVPLFKPPEASVGGIPLALKGAVACRDLTQFREASGHEVLGVIGLDFLSQIPFRINFDDGEVAFLHRVDETAPELGTQIAAAVDPRSGPILMAAASAEDIEYFVLDTGATTTATLSPILWGRLLESGQLTPLGNAPVLTLTGVSSQEIGMLHLMAIKAGVVGGPVVRQSDANVLGLGIMSRFVVTFDLPERRMFFKPGRRFDTKEPYDRSGLHILKRDGVVIVHSIDDDSPAATAGVRAGDELAGFNGRYVSEMTLFSIRRTLGLTDACTVTVRRDSQEIDLRLQRLQSDASIDDVGHH